MAHIQWVDYDEFDARMEARRAMRKPHRDWTDTLAVVIGAVMFCIIVFLTIWGVTA